MPKSTKRCLSSHTNAQTAQVDLPAPSLAQSALHATVGARLNRAFRRARHAVKIVPGDAPATENLKVLGAVENCPNPAVPPSLRRSASRASVSTDRMSNRTVRRRVNKKGIKAGWKRKSIPSVAVDEKDVVAEATAEKLVQSASLATLDTREEEQVLREAVRSRGPQVEQRGDASTFLRKFPSTTVDMEPCYSGKLVGWKTTTPTNPYILPTHPEPESSSDDTDDSDGLITRSPSPCSDITAPSVDSFYDHLSPRKLLLTIRPYEPDVAIWDAVRNTYYSFKCKLILKSTDQQQYGRFSEPDVNRIDFICSTFSPRGHYALRPSSMLYTHYKGATIASDRRITVNAADGVHIDEIWKPMKDDDGTRAWYVHVWTPIPMALFEKVDARLFRMVSRVWVEGRRAAEAEITFSVSTLFKQLDMA